MAFEVLPSSRARIAPSPLDPTTIAAAPRSCASSTIVSAALSSSAIANGSARRPTDLASWAPSYAIRSARARRLSSAPPVLPLTLEPLVRLGCRLSERLAAA
jgi:hypothetical protein